MQKEQSFVTETAVDVSKGHERRCQTKLSRGPRTSTSPQSSGRTGLLGQRKRRSLRPSLGGSSPKDALEPPFVHAISRTVATSTPYSLPLRFSWHTITPTSDHTVSPSNRIPMSSTSLSSQMRKLIVELLQKTRVPVVIIIDALDECMVDEPSSAILSILGRFVQKISNAKFFVTGRPSHGSTVDSASLSLWTRPMSSFYRASILLWLEPTFKFFWNTNFRSLGSGVS